MPLLNGHPTNRVAYVPAAATAAGIPIGGPTTSPAPGATSVVIDGTPVRVVTYALAAAAGLFALRMAGFKFNVGVAS